MSDVKLIGVDTETHLISREAVVPKMVCVSYYDEEADNSMVLSTLDPVLPEAVSMVLGDASYLKVLANAKFDLHVLARAYPDLVPVIFQEIMQSRVSDVQIREKLLNLAEFGRLSDIRIMGVWQRTDYKLSTLVKNYLGIDIAADKDSPDAWRTNYSVLEDTPVDQWPPAAVEYAANDAVLTVAVYKEQEKRREVLKANLGTDPLATEDFRVLVDFCLGWLTNRGMKVDPVQKAELQKMLEEELKPENLSLLYEHGILTPAVPEQPYKNGAKNEDGTPKMRAAIPEKLSRKTLIKYVLKQAETNPLIELEYNPPTEAEIKKAEEEGREPQGNLKLDDAWLKENAEADPVLKQFHHRQKLQKLVTTEIPRMEYVDEKGERHTAEVVHANFDCLKETGRTSSFAGDLYPSFNGQNVEPRARRCYLPREGMVLFSVDYNQMELGTAAQTCLDLFGYSELAAKINAGFDTHAYLGAFLCEASEISFSQRLVAAGVRGTDYDGMYRVFCALNKSEDPALRAMYKKYRTMAKPTGLGYPGGLGPKTFVKYAKAAYNVDIDLETAKSFREIWFSAYPEFREYFDHLTKYMIDPNHSSEEGEDRYHYTTPMGMYRANARYCAAANGKALQSPSAEGALLGLTQVVRACYDPTFLDGKPDELLYGKAFPLVFIHDEIVGEIPEDEYMQERVERVGQYMVDAMRVITPQVDARYGAALMRRWDKAAEAVYDAQGRLTIWEPKPEKQSA